MQKQVNDRIPRLYGGGFFFVWNDVRRLGRVGLDAVAVERAIARNGLGSGH
jgi:hypothetical protein